MAPMLRSVLVAALVALALAARAAGAAEAAPGLRVALIAGEGERKPADVFVAELEVKLSQQPEVALVERERIRGVLAEQKLTLAGLTEAATAAKVGQLLAADAFLFVETWRRNASAPCLARVVESRSGVTLDSLATTETDLAKDIGPLLAVLRRAQARAQIPPKDRRYVGLLGLRNEEPTRTLDGLAEALGAFLIADLAQAPRVIPVDREHLSQLTDEAKLGTIDPELKTAAVLIEGGVRRGPDAGELAATVDLRRPAGGPPQRLKLTLPAADVSAARRTLLTEVAKALDAGDIAAAPSGDPVVEAALFQRQAELLISWGENAAAVRAAEAAYALNPDQQTRTLATKAWYYLEVQVWGHAGQNFGRLSPAEQLRALAAALRERTLTLELCQCHAQRFEEGREADVLLPPVISANDRRELPTATDAAVAELETELMALDDEILAFTVGFYRKHYSLLQAQNAYWLAWLRLGAPRGFAPGRAGLLAQRVRQLVEVFDNPPGETLPDVVQSRLWMMSNWGEGLPLFNLRASPERAADRDVMVSLCRELAQHPDPFVRIVALNGLIRLGVDEEASARTLLQTFVKSLPPEHPYRRENRGICPLHWIVSAAVEVLGRTKPAEVDGFCRQILGPYLNSRDAAGLAAWERTVSWWLQALARSGQTREADALATAVLEAQRQASEPPEAGKAKRLEREVEARQAELAAKLEESPGAASPWDGCMVQPFDLGWGRVFPRLHVAGDRFYLVRDAGMRLSDEQKERREGLLSVDIFTLSDGRRSGSLGDLTLPPGTPLQWSVLDSVLAQDALYVATSTGLCRINLRRKPPQFVQQVTETLGTAINSLAWLDGRLYLGLGTGVQGKSGLACYDPKKGTTELLASAAATEIRSGLDGGTGYRINAMVSDPKRHCLWLAVATMEGRDRHGVWRYDPATGSAERTFASGFRVDDLAWASSGILGDELPGLVLYNLEAGSKIWLFTTRPQDLPPASPAARFPDGGVDMWPALYDGETLITGGRGQLHLHRPGSPPAPHPTVAAVSILEQTPYGILAVSNELSRAWLLRRQQGPHSER
jgi:hypothetical protein